MGNTQTNKFENVYIFFPLKMRARAPSLLARAQCYVSRHLHDQHTNE